MVIDSAVLTERLEGEGKSMEEEMFQYYLKKARGSLFSRGKINDRITNLGEAHGFLQQEELYEGTPQYKRLNSVVNSIIKDMGSRIGFRYFADGFEKTLGYANQIFHNAETYGLVEEGIIQKEDIYVPLAREIIRKFESSDVKVRANVSYFMDFEDWMPENWNMAEYFHQDSRMQGNSPEMDFALKVMAKYKVETNNSRRSQNYNLSKMLGL